MNGVRTLSTMTKIGAAIFCAFTAVVSMAAPRPTPVPPLYLNDTPILPPEQPPLVDAFMFINQSTIVASNNYLFPPLSVLPWDAQSVQIWTNSGSMVGYPGFRFNYTANPAHLTRAQRRKKGALVPQSSLVFDNNGEITVTEFLEIQAKRLVNSGVLSGDVNARFRLWGGAELMDLSRGAIRVGDLPQPDCTTVSNLIFGPFFFFGDPAVNYVYFDSGTSGFVNTNRSPLFLPSLNQTFAPPNPTTPSFQYRQTVAVYPGAPATNTITNTFFGPLLTCGDYDTFVHFRTNVFGGPFFTNASRDINIVFVPTNGLSENVSVSVAFPTNQFFFFNDAPIVEFRATYDDVITQQRATNYLTFRNDGNNVFRAKDCEFDLAEGPNALFTPDIFYSTNFLTNVVDYSYTVSLVNVGNTNSVYFTNDPSSQFFFFPPLGQSLAASDPTNLPGQVQIVANNLNLDQARIRAENGIFIRATNLVGNFLGITDAPFISVEAAASNPDLVISNFTRAQVTRLQAQLNSWSASWSVQVNNNGVVETWNYRVLVLGACVNTLAPTITHRLTLQATNVLLEDNLAVNAAFELNGYSFTVGSNGSLTMPAGSSLAFTNLIGLGAFTNYGTVNVPRGAFFGLFEEGYQQPPAPRRRNKKKAQPPRLTTYDSIVNHGIVNAASTKLRATEVEHTGLPFDPAVILGTNGPVTLDGGTLLISNALVQARSDVRLTAGDALITRSTLIAGATNAGVINNYLPGSIILDITNSITDGGVGASNDWRVTAGVRMAREPEFPGDLMGTRIVSLASTFVESVHAWAGLDFGATPDGFFDNLALGRLVLDGAMGNRFRFRSAVANNAIYVDYLELLNDATNFSFAFGVAPDFTIYFADSNVDPEKLDSLNNGRIRWVPDFIGPQSATNLLYPDGNTYTFNAGVVRSQQRDDDGDRIANAEDCTPIPVPGVDTTTQNCGIVPPPVPLGLMKAASGLSLAISLSEQGGAVVLEWNAPARSANVVEFTDSLGSGQWQTLTNFNNGPVDARVTVRDEATAPSRVYRVRVDAGKP